MSDNVHDLRRYKLAKVLVKDLSQIISEYDEIIKALDIMKNAMVKWKLYKSCNHVGDLLHKAHFEVLGQKTFLQASLNREMNVIRSKKTT